MLVGRRAGGEGLGAGVVAPVGLHEHGVDLVEADGFDAVAGGFDEGPVPLQCLPKNDFFFFFFFPCQVGAAQLPLGALTYRKVNEWSSCDGRLVEGFLLGIFRERLVRGWPLDYPCN